MRLRTQVVSVLGGTVLMGLAVIATMYRTTPQGIGPNRVTLWFLGLMLALTGIIAIILFASKHFLLPEATLTTIWYASLRQGFLIAGWAVTTLGLSSLHQLTLRDGFLTAILLLLVELYVRLK